MDYFSELLESYSKLKKRTFKLTYINEAEEGREQFAGAALQAGQEVFDSKQTQDGLGNSSNITIEYIPGDPEKRTGEKIKVGGSNLGFGMTFDKNKWANVFKKVKKGTNGYKILGAWAGVEEKDTGPKTPEQENAEIDSAVKSREEEQARQAELEAQAAEKAPYHFERAQYSLDKNDPQNITRTIDAVEKTMIGLNNYCDGFGDAPNPPIICGPNFRTRFISSEGESSFAYKLANGTAINPEDGEATQAPPGLLNDVAENHEEFMSFLYNKPTDPKLLEEKCKSLNDKVGFHDGNLIIFGKDRDATTGKPNNGLTFSTQGNKLYQEVEAAVRSSCGNTWEPERTYTQQVTSSKALNTIRGTLNEKCLNLAIKLFKPGLTDEERQEAYREVAQYIKKHEEHLLKFAREKFAGQEGAVAQDLQQFSDAQVLMEQAQLAQDEGVEGLLRYTLGVIQKHSEFVKLLGAADSYDASKQSGQGNRADTVAVFDTKEEAYAAAERAGVDPKRAVRTGTPGTPGEGRFEIGIGVKDKKGGIAGYKMGEYNTTARRRAAIRGEIPSSDSSFYAGFLAWADNLQFGGPVDSGEAKERHDNFLSFEEDLESSVEELETTLVTGRFYIGRDGQLKSQSGESQCANVSKTLKEILGYKPMPAEVQGPAPPRTDVELYDSFVGDDKIDWSDKSERERAAESLTRVARMRKVRDAYNNPETKQVAQDWVIRNLLMTGGDARDIIQLQTSYDEDRSVATDHNAVLRMIAENPDNVDFEFGDYGVRCTIDGLTVTLGFERTDATKGSKRNKETRTKVDIDKASTTDPRISKEIKSKTKKGKGGSVNADTMYQFLAGQMKLLEEILNSSK